MQAKFKGRSLWMQESLRFKAFWFGHIGVDWSDRAYDYIGDVAEKFNHIRRT